MLYSFEVSMSDKDYFEYNKFHIQRSPYGRKYKTMVNVAFIAFACAAMLLMLLTIGASIETLIGVIPVILLSGVLMLLYPHVVVLILRLNILLTKNRPNKPYAPWSRIEFGEEFFAEETELGRTETKYFAIERISVTDSAVYMHLNATTAYILPMSLFEDCDELDVFLDFLKTKNERITVYRRKNKC